MSSSDAPFRDGVGGGIGERHPHIFGLGAVDEMAEAPAASTYALPVAGFAAEPAGAARGAARDEDPVADLHVLDAVADGLDGADGFVAEGSSVGHFGDVTFEDVEVRSADRGRVDLDDRVGVFDQNGLGHFLPGLAAGAVVHQGLHH